MTTSEWQTFEVAVANFIRALDPSAVVQHNAHVPDIDTGRPRQRDVWVETRIGGHFPVKILVSCKRTSTKLHQQDIDAFIGELRSSGAHKGVLYSYSGFTKPALEKAALLGICCCRLYEDQSPDLPEVLIFNAYCNIPRIRLHLSEDPGARIQTMNELFDIRVSELPEERTVFDALLDDFLEKEALAVKRVEPDAPLPPGWQSGIEITGNRLSGPVVIGLEGGWKLYRAKIEAFLFNGSYSLTSRDFKGSQDTPWIDTQSSHPGPGWELIDPPPPKVELGYVRFILHGGNVREAVRNYYGIKSPKSLPSRANIA